MDITQIPITLTMTVAQVNTILAALGKLPHDDVSDIIVGIRRVALQQIEAAQQQAQAEPKAEAESEGGEAI